MLYPMGKQKRRFSVVKFLFLILLLCAETANSQTLWGVDWETATPEQIQKLIDDGASVTDALLMATGRSNLAVIEALIKAKADVNARDKNGWTPLIAAASGNSDLAVIEALIKAKADVNARDKKYELTPLMLAARFNSNPAVIEALIKAKADVNARDISGKTAFDYAEDNPEIKGTPVYWKLNDLMYK